MKYYSEKTRDLYETEEELKAAEKAKDEEILAEQEKRNARAKRAKEVEEAYLNYQKLLKDFIKDYGSYHMSIKDDNLISLFMDNFFLR